MMHGRGMPAGEERLPSDVFPAAQVVLATRISSRMRGLLFSPASNGVMVLMPCHDIHTFGMSYAIDVAFLDADGKVMRAMRDVLPNKRLRQRGAAAVVERRAIPREVWFEEGDRIELGRFRRENLSEASALTESVAPG